MKPRLMTETLDADLHPCSLLSCDPFPEEKKRHKPLSTTGGECSMGNELQALLNILSLLSATKQRTTA